MTPAGCGLPLALWPWPQPTGLDVSWFEILPRRSALFQTVANGLGKCNVKSARRHGAAGGQVTWSSPSLVVRKGSGGLGRLAVGAQRSGLPTLSAVLVHQAPLSAVPWGARQRLLGRKGNRGHVLCKAPTARAPVPVPTDIRRGWADNVAALRAGDSWAPAPLPGRLPDSLTFSADSVMPLEDNTRYLFSPGQNSIRSINF